MGVIIDTPIKKAVTLYDVLHVFSAGKAIVTAILELKLTQKLVSVDQDSLFFSFLELRKLNDNLDRDRILKTLDGYGSGPKMRCILDEL